MRSFCFVCIALLWTVSLGAQAIPPNSDSLLVRLQHGDESVRRRLESIARPFLISANERSLPGDVAHRVATIALSLAAPISPPENAPTRREMDWRRPAVRILVRTLALDSGDVWSAGQLEQLTPYPYLWLAPHKELAHLRALARRDAALPPALVLAWFGLELEVGSPDSAAVAMATPGLTQVSAAVRFHLLAELEFARGRDAAGTDTYYHGARAIASPDDVAAFSRDLSWIARTEELAEWKRLAADGTAQEAWLRVFWTRRDFRDGRPAGTRLPEHFARWRAALRAYRWDLDGSVALAMTTGDIAGFDYNDGDARFPIDDAQAEQIYRNRLNPLSRILDDRGRLVMRLGLPTAQSLLPGVTAGSEENLIWITPDGPTIVGFSRPGVKVEKDPKKPPVILMKYGMLGRNYPVGDLMAVCHLDPRLCSLAGSVEISLMTARSLGATTLPTPPWKNQANRIRIDYTRMRELAERSETNRETFSDSLGAALQAYGVPGGGVLVVTSVPVEKLVPDAKVRDITRTLGIRLRSLIGDSAKGVIVGMLDTVRTSHIAASPLPGSQVSSWILVPSPVGVWSVDVVVSSLGGRAGTGRMLGEVPVIALGATTLTLGDPILGRTGSGLVWKNARGVLVELNPTGAWRKSDVAVLHYTIAGAVPGHVLDTRIEIWDTKGQPKKPRLAIGFSEPATGITQEVRRDLLLRELEAGAYRLVISIRDATEHVASSRERRLIVTN